MSSLQNKALNAAALNLENIVDPVLLRHSMSSPEHETRLRNMYKRLPYPKKLWQDIIDHYYRIGLFVSLDYPTYESANVNVQTKRGIYTINFVSDGEYFLDSFMPPVGHPIPAHELDITGQASGQLRFGMPSSLVDYNGKIALAFERLQYEA